MCKVPLKHKNKMCRYILYGPYYDDFMSPSRRIKHYSTMRAAVEMPLLYMFLYSTLTHTPNVHIQYTYCMDHITATI